MRMDKLTARLQQALSDAQSLAVGQGNSTIEPVHLMLALMQQQGGAARPLLEKTGANSGDVITALNMAVDKLPTVGDFNGDVQMGQATGRLLNMADREAQQRGDQYLSTEVVLLAACDDNGELGKLMKNA
ncbi:Clp protease N-terminal domain-containing protein, partial [Alcanivorax sp.]